MFKGFNELFEDIVSKLQLTTREKAVYKSSLKNSIKRWRIKGFLKPDELPDMNDDLVWSWKVQQDKEMINQMAESLASRGKNYKRKVFGLKNSQLNQRYFRMMIEQLLKEGFTLQYPDQKSVDEFFTDKKIK